MAGPRARSQPLGGRGMARGSILGRWPRSPTKQTGLGATLSLQGSHANWQLLDNLTSDCLLGLRWDFDAGTRPSTSAGARPGDRWWRSRLWSTHSDACDPRGAAEPPPTPSRMPPAPAQKERMKTRRQQQGASFTLCLDVDGDGRAYRDACRRNIWRRCTMSN